MKNPLSEKGRTLAQDAALVAAVALLVFVIGWTGVRIASVVQRNPVKPGKDGLILLTLVKSDRRGDVAFEEGPGYQGWWHCTGTNWVVEWRFQLNTTSTYEIEVLLATPVPPANQPIEVTLQNAVSGEQQVWQAAVPETGGRTKWKPIRVAEAVLAPGRHALTVAPASGGLTNVNLKSVTLRPKATAL